MQRFICGTLGLLVYLCTVSAYGNTSTTDGFSARMITTIQGRTSIAEIKGTPEMLHMKVLGGRTFSTMIVRFDREVLWLLAPPAHQYHELDLKSMGTRIPHFFRGDMHINKTKVGAEMVNGVPALKYKASVTDPDKKSYTGFLWEAVKTFPLPLKWQDSSRNLEVTWEDINQVTLPLSLFSPPPGFLNIESQKAGGTSMGNREFHKETARQRKE